MTALLAEPHFAMDPSNPSRPRKHEISFLLDVPTPPAKRERLLVQTSPISTRSDSPLLQPLPLTHPVQAIQCSECNHVSNDPDSATAHARASHPNKPFACRICGRCFGEKGNMNKHIRLVLALAFYYQFCASNSVVVE